MDEKTKKTLGSSFLLQVNWKQEEMKRKKVKLWYYYLEMMFGSKILFYVCVYKYMDSYINRKEWENYIYIYVYIYIICIKISVFT